MPGPRLCRRAVAWGCSPVALANLVDVEGANGLSSAAQAPCVPLPTLKRWHPRLRDAHEAVYRLSATLAGPARTKSRARWPRRWRRAQPCPQPWISAPLPRPGPRRSGRLSGRLPTGRPPAPSAGSSRRLQLCSPAALCPRPRASCLPRAGPWCPARGGAWHPRRARELPPASRPPARSAGLRRHREGASQPRRARGLPPASRPQPPSAGLSRRPSCAAVRRQGCARARPALRSGWGARPASSQPACLPGPRGSGRLGTCWGPGRAPSWARPAARTRARRRAVRV